MIEVITKLTVMLKVSYTSLVSSFKPEIQDTDLLQSMTGPGVHDIQVNSMADCAREIIDPGTYNISVLQTVV